MTAIRYNPGTVGDSHRYDVSGYGYFDADDVAHMGFEDIAPCATSPCWEDRVRAAYLMKHIEVTLPDGFICLYETADSPNHSRNIVRRDDPWVVSPDADMLTALLPEYQWMWDGYTAKWGSGARRTFAVGPLDGVPAYQVYRPGTTVEDVLLSTARRHGLPLPERLRR
jgi:hypothetical protein